ncbi:hypothetical protein ABW19_dt0201978 [Dactylella cylindrospora]|nr:hypothetical protein ABW19_dt0201978 [Dactylella cylindrospora]
MDLLKGPIREGSRGGREFKWSDVKDSKDREYYLGVSVKAPTGRWQQNRDIQWYSRDSGSQDQAALDRERARAEEIKRIKEAENDALSAALGFKVARRRTDAEGLSQGEVDRAIKEAGEVVATGRSWLEMPGAKRRPSGNQPESRKAVNETKETEDEMIKIEEEANGKSIADVARGQEIGIDHDVTVHDLGIGKENLKATGGGVIAPGLPVEAP